MLSSSHNLIKFKRFPLKGGINGAGSVLSKTLALSRPITNANTNVRHNYKMTKRDTLEIALKVLGLYLLTVAFDSLIGIAKSSTFFFIPHSADSNEDLIYFIVNSFRTFFYIFGFWLLTFKTDYLTAKLIKTNSENTSPFAIGKADLLQILFSTSGIIITFFSVSELWNALTMSSIWNYNDIPEKNGFLIYLMQIGIPLTKGLIGLTLIFASGGLARLLIQKKK